MFSINSNMKCTFNTINYAQKYPYNREQHNQTQRTTSSNITFNGNFKSVTKNSFKSLFSSARELVNEVLESCTKKLDNLAESLPKQIAKNTNEISAEEMKYYDEIISEFSEIFPPIKSTNPIWNEKNYTQLHISGDKTIMIHNFDTGEIKYAELQRDGEKLFIDLRPKFLGIQKKQSSEQLTAEFERFLDGQEPSADLFTEFVKRRDIKHILEECPNLKEIRRNKLKADEIERIEKLDLSRKEEMYKSLWKSYPTEKFYRIIGENELDKLLKGEVIKSLHPERKRIDITSHPNYNLIFFGENKFRITFKQKDFDGGYHERLTRQIAPCKPEYFHYTIQQYDINDIDINDIHYWNGCEWVKLH